MEYKIYNLKSTGELEPSGILTVEGQSFNFATENSGLARMLEKVKQQGYVINIGDIGISLSGKVKPGDNDFISALEEYLGNYKIRRAIG